MKTIPLFAAALLAHGLFAAATPAYDDDTTPTEMTVTVAEGADTLDVAIPATVTKFVKAGAGKLTLTKAALWTKGAVEVLAGTLALGADGYAGTPASITVEKGATLDLTGIKNAFADTQLTIGGTGAAGQEGAAVRAASGYDAQALFNKITLTGDTTIQAAGNDNATWGFGQLSGKACTFDMAGYTLTCKGNVSMGNHRASGAMKVDNPGDIIVAANGYLRWSSSDKVVVSPKPSAGGKTLTMQNGAVFYHYMMRHGDTADWKLVVPEGSSATFKGFPHASLKQQYYYGDVQVDGTLSCWSCQEPANTGCEVVFTGTISGSGTLKGASSDARARNVRFTGTGNAPKAHRINRLDVSAGPLVFRDSGTLTVTNLGFTAGTLSGEGEVSIGGVTWDGSLARLVLDGKTAVGSGEAESMTSVKSGNDKYLHQISVGTGTATTYSRIGVLDVRNGASVTNHFVVGSSYSGSGSGNYGAIYLSGAESHLRWTTAARSQLADSGYGYIGIDDGLFEMPGSECPGQGNIFLVARLNGRGYIVQRGGRAVFGNLGDRSVWLTRPAGRGHSEYVQLGGTCTLSHVLCFFGSENSLGTGGDSAGLTVGGGTGPATFTASSVASWSTTNKTGSTSWINLNAGGTLACKYIYKEQGNFAEAGRDYTSAKFYLNFNGGTLKPTATVSDFFYNVAKRAPTRVTVFKGGATIDTDGHDVGWGAPLLRPTGYGVKSVQLSQPVRDANKFIGPLRVKAVAGDGVAFTALTDFDNAGRTNRGVIVTCPGFGFSGTEETASFVRAEERAWGYTANLVDGNGTLCGYDCTATLEQLDVTGGFTKKGAGTLTLKGANTYGGTTRIEGGALAFTHADGLPGGDIEFSAEAVAASTPGAPLLVADTLKLDAGKKIRITGVDRLTAETFGRMRTLVSVTTPMTAMPAVELVDSNGQAVSTGVWRFSLSADGKALKFGRASGLIITVQ